MACALSRVSMAVNGTLAVVKVVAGIAGDSYALIADAVESLGDIVSSMVGDWWSQRLMLRGDRGATPSRRRLEQDWHVGAFRRMRITA